jgi:DHA1 family tetracycline resistance protein-like MFS transporter
MKILPLLFFTLLLDAIGVGMILPVLPTLLTDPTSPHFLLGTASSSLQYAVAGLLTASFGICWFIASPIAGELSDIFGRKRVLLTGVAILAVSQIIFGLAVTVGSLVLLFVSRAISGLSAGNMSVVQALIADITKPEDRAKNFGLIGTAYGLGFILGPLLSGYIIQSSGSASLPFFVAGFLGLLNFIFVLTSLKETHKVSEASQRKFSLLTGGRNIVRAFEDKKLRPYYTASFLFQFGFSLMIAFVGVLLVSRFSFTSGQLATYFGIVGVFIIVTQAVIIRIVTKFFSSRTITLASFTILAVGLFGYALPLPLIAVYLSVPFIAIGSGLGRAMIGSLISRHSSKDEQGVVLGINGSLGALTQGLGPLVGGVAASLVSIHLPFAIGGVSSLIAFYIIKKHRD